MVQSTAYIPRIIVCKKEAIETLINEKALLFAKFLRNEIQIWKPRIAVIGDKIENKL